MPEGMFLIYDQVCIEGMVFESFGVYRIDKPSQNSKHIGQFLAGLRSNEAGVLGGQSLDDGNTYQAKLDYYDNLCFNRSKYVLKI
jgi:hypothetical protein